MARVLIDHVTKRYGSKGEVLAVDDLSDWGNRMIELNQKYGVRILGGCCGTDAQHLQYIVDNVN